MSPSEKNHAFRQDKDLLSLFERMKKDGFSLKYSKREVTAYHGTSVACATSILQDKRIRPTLNVAFPGEDEFLGEGQYLWQDSEAVGGGPGHKAAIYRASRRYPAEKIAVIVATLNFKKLLDLNVETNRLYASTFRVRLETQGVRELRHDWEFVKLLILSSRDLAENDIDGVCWRGFQIEQAPEWLQIGYCVKNDFSITRLRLFEG